MFCGGEASVEPELEDAEHCVVATDAFDDGEELATTGIGWATSWASRAGLLANSNFAISASILESRARKRS